MTHALCASVSVCVCVSSVLDDTPGFQHDIHMRVMSRVVSAGSMTGHRMSLMLTL